MAPRSTCVRWRSLAPTPLHRKTYAPVAAVSMFPVRQAEQHPNLELLADEQ